MAFPSTGYATQSVTAGASLTDFTLIVDLSDMPADWWTENDTADGTKGRVFKEDETELAVDWISFDSGADSGWVRVKWSGTFSGAGANTIRIYPPVAANDSVAAGDTFGAFNAFDDDWKLYLPLDEVVNNDVDGYKDRTVNANHGQGVSMALPAVAGQVGNAQDFDGSADYIDLPDVAYPIANGYTLVAWINTGGSSTGQIIGRDSFGGNRYWQFRVDSGGGKIRFIRFDASNNLVANFGTPLSYNDSAQHQIVATFSTANGSVIYVDGESVATDLDTTANRSDSGATPSIGSTGNGAEFFDGLIDEGQIHSTARSADWIAEEFASTDDNATYWGVWEFVEVLSFDEDVVELTVVMAREQALEVVMAQEQDLEVTMAQEQALTVVI